MGRPLRSIERGDRDRVEMRHAVRLGPQRDLTWGGEGLVLGGKEWLAIERNGEPVPFGAQAEGVPLISGDLRAHALDLRATALHHTIEVDVVFECISPH